MLMSEGLDKKNRGLRSASLMRISIIIAHNESKLLNYFVARFSHCRQLRREILVKRSRAWTSLIMFPHAISIFGPSR